MKLELDHLVVAARTLEEGAAWCEATLGVVPAAGGRHPLMGTHNRLLAIASPTCPRSYLEIIAIDPAAPAPGTRKRWFDLDDAALQARIAAQPMLVHWVVRSTDLTQDLATLRDHGFDLGEAAPAERDTPRGRLHWQISLRADGQRLRGGAMPLLIQWGELHPSDSLPTSGVQLTALQVAGWPATVDASLPGVELHAASAEFTGLRATLSSPRGLVHLITPNPPDAHVPRA